MKKVITVIIALVTASGLSAQTKNHFEIETDPLAYMLGGASGHVAFTWKNERIQLGYGQLTMPEAMQNHENVTESFRAISLKWDYFFGKDSANQGFFAGPTFDYTFLKYEDHLADVFKERQLILGLRGGYKFDLFKESKALRGLYVTPWIGVSAFTKNEDVVLNDVSYKRSPITFFPTVHVGWSF